MENWRNITGWEHQYEVSDLGRVRNKQTHHILTPMKTGSNRKSGYKMKVRFSTHPRIDMSVDHLVLSMFIRAKLSNEVSMHLNDEPADNRLSNLKWGTYQENALDSALKFRGGGQKLSVNDVAIIKTCREIGMTGAALSRLFSVSQQRICDIYKNRTAIGRHQ